MDELEFSVLSYTAESVNALKAALRDFELRHHCEVKLTNLNWETGWAEVMKYALYGHGPAISEVGSTWVASLVAMNAVRQFEAHEVAELGGPSAFLPAMWQSGIVQNALWAVPWLAETRVIFYRRDILAQAGIDPAGAFETPARLEDTLQRLQAAGHPIPFTLNTRQSLNTIHHIATWVWGAGGDFVDADLRRVEFDQPQAHSGMVQFYGLHRFLAPEARNLTITQSEALYQSGRAAVTLSGPWLMLSPEDSLAPEVLEHTGAALPPGVPFVGGSHFVIWWSAPPRQQSLALELVRYLTSEAAQIECGKQSALLPIRTGTLNRPPFAENQLYPVMERSLQAGRTFPAMRLWGLIEDKLAAALNEIWHKVLAEARPNIDAIITAQLHPLAQRINWIMESDTARRG